MFTFPNFKSRRSLKKVHTLIPLGIQIEKDFNYINTRIKLWPSKVLKVYVNYENLIQDRKTATIKKSTEQHL